MNNLANETSPYLLQHAHNPVDWYAWGQDALDKALSENKPILVSIGYSACHWCHVMERESFENETVAEVMNEFFVNIKIDREERPDIDAIYMDAVQAMGIRGGWPLNVFLMPDGKPFYGGTYFPKHKWIDVLNAVNEGFENKQDALQESAEGFTQNMLISESEKYGLNDGENDYSVEDLNTMYQKIAFSFDNEWGGVGGSPKFPMPSVYQFLLRYYEISKNPAALNHINLSLQKIASGGIYDQLKGGFSRYSVDAEWFAPHFEKMLYDNGQLLSIYSEAYLLTKNEQFKEVVYETINWVKTEMTSQDGGFYSALDADSEGVEGKFYTWTFAEIQAILGADAKDFCKAYQITEHGNWEEGVNILWKKDGFLNEKFASQIEKLMLVRAKRIRPGLDDKILCSWNGLMLRGLVDAYRVFGEKDFLDLALENAQFIADVFVQGEELYHSFKNGKLKILGFLEDYASVIDAFTALYQVTFDENWLHLAELLTIHTYKNFYDQTDHFFFFTDNDAEDLIARKKEIFDNVVSSSNSMMARNYYTLGVLLDREDFVKLSQKMLSKMRKLLITNIDYLTNWGCLVAQNVSPTIEIAIVGEKYQEFRAELELYFKTNKVICGTKEWSDLPLLENRTAPEGETLIFICQNKTCQLPVKSVAEAVVQLSVINLFADLKS
jgi:uncharacterized protein